MIPKSARSCVHDEASRTVDSTHGDGAYGVLR